MSIDIFLKLILEEIFYIIEHFQNICVMICYNFTVKYFAFKMNGGSKMKKILLILLVVGLMGTASNFLCNAGALEETQIKNVVTLAKSLKMMTTDPNDKIPKIKEILQSLSPEELENLLNTNT